MVKALRRRTHRSPARFNARVLPGAKPAEYPGFPRLRKLGTTWVEPKLEAEIDYRAVTGDRHLRHPSVKGLAEE
jgi:hypothetical protein